MAHPDPNWQKTCPYCDGIQCVSPTKDDGDDIENWPCYIEVCVKIPLPMQVKMADEILRLKKIHGRPIND